MKTMTGRSAFLTLLKDEGIRYLFGNPGTTELPIMDALSEHSDLTYVLGLQEAIVVAMADGYSRASGQLSSCNVHVAPGLGNAMGSLYNAKWYGSPVLITAGQQEQGHGLMEPLLYDPLVPIATPLVKWAVEVNRLQDLPRIVRRAAKIAMTPPTGPVFISLPGDVLNDRGNLELGHSTRVETANRPCDESLKKLAKRLISSKNPVILAGHELCTREALTEATQFAELLGAPVYQQTVPYTAQYLSEHVTFMGALNRDQLNVHSTLLPYDLLICLGADVLRMSVWNKLDPLPEKMPVIQIGERDWELGKNYPAEIAIHADIKETLKAVIPVLSDLRSEEYCEAAQIRINGMKNRNWAANRRKLMVETQGAEKRVAISASVLMMRIAEALPKDAVVVDEGITSSKSLLSFFPFHDAHCYFGLASGGIGFAVAGAIGIHLAQPQRPLLALIGDGSAMYNIQALWTAAHLKLPITYLIANNKSYRILKERLLAFQGNPNFIGMDFKNPEIDFVSLAQSFGLKATRVEEADAIAPALYRSLNDRSGPHLIDVIIDDGFS
ncbi:MAG: thiamine pyrophosphate-binding protein [SAR324 cluster bacterium]|nr:thiamine pyrophosphate-binding protein [SAR324 cluster bacterium]